MALEKVISWSSSWADNVGVFVGIKENLRATAKTVDDKKQGTGIHWFLCEKAYLNNPTALFEENWHNAKDDALHHLID